MIQNITEEDYDLVDLIQPNPYNNGRQSPIYLVIDWENGTVDVETHTGNGVPESVWNRRSTRIRLPDNINIDRIHEDVDDLIPRLELIHAGYETYYDGHNNRGVFSEDAVAELNQLEFDINMNPATIFRINDIGGLCDIGYWYEDTDEIVATTTDEEIRELAEYHYSDAYNQGVVISGGVDSIVEHLTEIRSYKIEDADDDC